MDVTVEAVEKSGYDKYVILSRYNIAKIGYDGTFTLGTNLFAVDKQQISDTIVWTGEVPIEWYEEDLKVEENDRIRKAKQMAERGRRLYFAGREGTKTERKRDKRASNLISRNCK